MRRHLVFVKNGDATKVVECFGVGQCLGVFDSFSMHDGAYCKFDDFAAFRSWNICDGHDLRRDVPRRRIVTNFLANPALQFVIEFETGAQYDEQHDPDVVIPVLANRDALDNLVKFLDLPIDLGCANAYTARVQDSVRTPMNDQAATRR